MTTYHSNGEFTAEDQTDDQSAAGKKAAAMREQVETHMRDAREAVDDTAKQVSEAVDRHTKDGVRFVRENPGMAIAGAVGAGIVLGLLLRGK